MPSATPNSRVFMCATAQPISDDKIEEITQEFETVLPDDTVLEVTDYDEDGATVTLFEVSFPDSVAPDDYEENFDAAQDRLIVLGLSPSIVDDSELDAEV